MVHRLVTHAYTSPMQGSSSGSSTPIDSTFRNTFETNYQSSKVILRDVAQARLTELNAAQAMIAAGHTPRIMSTEYIHTPYDTYGHHMPFADYQNAINALTYYESSLDPLEVQMRDIFYGILCDARSRSQEGFVEQVRKHKDNVQTAIGWTEGNTDRHPHKQDSYWRVRNGHGNRSLEEVIELQKAQAQDFLNEYS